MLIAVETEQNRVKLCTFDYCAAERVNSGQVGPSCSLVGIHMALVQWCMMVHTLC